MRALIAASALGVFLLGCDGTPESPSPTSAGAGGNTMSTPNGGGSTAAGAPNDAGGAPENAGQGGSNAGATMAGRDAGGAPDEGAVTSWPGPADVTALPATGLVDGNVSGLTYQPASGAEPPVLWATANIPGNLYRLLPTSDGFASDSANGWSQGKLLHFPSGKGAADAESVTLGATPSAGLYVASEHDNSAASLSRLSILRYEVSGATASLTAAQEWNVTSALPTVGANLGIEAITFVPDADLTAKGFVDENKQAPYQPGDYREHGGGVFFVGVEGTGKIHGLVLNHESGAFQLVTTIETPFPGVMSLEYDRDVGYLWFGCDATCDNQTGILDVTEDGHFTVRRRFEKPAQLPSSDNEGIAIAPESECSAGLKGFYWTDDANLGGLAIRRGQIPCGAFL